MLSVVVRVESNLNDCDANNITVEKKTRGQQKDYEEYASYPSLLKAKEAIDEGIEGQWSKQASKNNERIEPG